MVYLIRNSHEKILVRYTFSRHSSSKVIWPDILVLGEIHHYIDSQSWSWVIKAFGYLNVFFLNVIKVCSSSVFPKNVGIVFQDGTFFISIVEMLQYCDITRLKITYVINKLCQLLYSPPNSHWLVAKSVLRYLKGIVFHGILFNRIDVLGLIGFINTDWTSYFDGCQSTKRYYIYFGDSIIFLSSSKKKL